MSHSTPEPAPETEKQIAITKKLAAFIIIVLGFSLQMLLYLVPVEEIPVLPNLFWFGILLLGVFTAILVFRPPAFLVKALSRLPLSNQVILILGSIALSVSAAIGSANYDKTNRTGYIPLATFWLLSAICYVASFFSMDQLPAQLKAFFKEHRNELIGIGMVTLLAAFLRLYKLGELPFVINGDEGWLGMVVKSTDTGPLSNPFALWENFGAFYLHWIRDSVKFFGNTPFALRLFPALGGVAAIPALYLLSREIAGRRVAFITAGMIAISHAHLNFSRTAAVAYIQETWLIPLEFYFFLSGLRKRSLWRTALAGAILAIHYCVYLSAQISTGLLLVYILILVIFYRSWFKTIWRQIVAFWGGLFIVLLPELVYIFQHTNEFFNRINKDGLFQSGWLDATIAATGKSAVQVLLERVFHALLSLVYFPALDFYGSPLPLMSFITAALFMIGLLVVIWRTRAREYLLLNGYFWAFTLAIGMFAIPPSADSYRMLVVLPAASIMAGIGFDLVLEKCGASWDRHRLAYASATSIIFFCLLSFNTWAYFSDFVGNCKYGGDTQTRYSTHLGYYLNTVRRDANVYLLSNQTIFYGQNLSVDFLSEAMKITNIPEAVDTIPADPGTIIIAIPERMQELHIWAKNNPGGNFTYRTDCKSTILSAYEIP